MDHITQSAQAEIFIFTKAEIINPPSPQRGAPRKTQPSARHEALQAIRRKQWSSYYYHGDIVKIWSKMVTNNAKKRARLYNIHFDLTCEQIRNLLPLNMLCPIIGLKMTMERGHKGMTPTSATVDRIDPRGPYSVKNCHIVSNVANRGKSNLSLRQLADAGKWATKTLKNLARRKPPKS